MSEDYFLAAQGSAIMMVDRSGSMPGLCKRPPGDRKAGLPALGRIPSGIAPIGDVPNVLDFPRDVQPIRDHRRLKCHGCGQPGGGVAPIRPRPEGVRERKRFGVLSADSSGG